MSSERPTTPAQFTTAAAEALRALEHLNAVIDRLDSTALDNKTANKLLTLKQDADKAIADIKAETFNVMAYLHAVEPFKVVQQFNTDEQKQ